MYCSECGAYSSGAGRYCASCGATLHVSATPGQSGAGATATLSAASFGASSARPENHLVKSILVTLFCCLPFGIAAIVSASRVDSAYDRGDVAEAERLSDKANGYANTALVIGLIVGVIYFLIGIAGALG